MKQNSEEYWDDRFSSDWEENDGRAQTAYFAGLMVKSLPEEIVGEIAIGKYRIVDFGCAMGDCAGALKKMFPRCEVVGMDFSKVAIERARTLFPDCNFVHGDIHAQVLSCDVAICSNVLEHLSDPQKVLDRLFANASRYVIVMVPYEEQYLVPEHISRFTPRSFPPEKCGFSLECIRRVVSDDARRWAGSQLLVVYKKYRTNEPRTPSSNLAEQLQGQWTDPLDIVVQHVIENGAKTADVRSVLDSVYAGTESRFAGLERQLLDMMEVERELLKKNSELTDNLSNAFSELMNRLDSMQKGLDSLDSMRQSLDSLDSMRRSLDSLDSMRQGLDSLDSMRQSLDSLDSMRQSLDAMHQHLDYVAESVDSMAKEQYQYANVTLWELRQFVCKWNKGALRNFILSLPVLGGLLKRGKRVVVRIRSEGLAKALRFYKMKYLGCKPTPFVMELIRTERKKRRYRGVYVLPTIPWDVPIFQRPQQMAIAMAKKGFLVIYLEHIHNCPAGTVREVLDGLFVVTVGDYGAVIRDLSNCIISVYSTATCFAEQDIVTLQLAKRNTLVYEYIDHFDEKISGPEAASLVAFFSRVVAPSFPMKYLASARILQRELERRTGKKVAYVANGVDAAHFSAANIQKILKQVELPACLKSEKPKVGYFGAMAPWLDYEMIGAVLKMHPEWEFIFIGPDYFGGSKQLPADQTNCHWLGPVAYSDLPAYANSFDVAILPFAKGPLSKSTSPLKLFEYFALGKPVVVTPDMDECVAFREVLVGDGAEGFANAIADALEKAKDSEFVESLHRLALENSWEARAQAFIEAVTMPD